MSYQSLLEKAITPFKRLPEIAEQERLEGVELMKEGSIGEDYIGNL